MVMVSFQFTPLREGRQAARPGTADDTRFQFTPLREGRPATEAKLQPWLISIHAPPRGATISGTSGERFYTISIHAPPRGATLRAKTLTEICNLFQFTPLREGRHSILGNK